jgi:hypothetical protein
VTPEPAGICDMCTREKNELATEHTTQVMTMAMMVVVVRC